MDRQALGTPSEGRIDQAWPTRYHLKSTRSLSGAMAAQSILDRLVRGSSPLAGTNTPEEPIVADRADAIATADIGRVFLVYGSALPPVVVIAAPKGMTWHRDVLPAVKRAANEIAGRRLSWSDLGVDGLPSAAPDEATYLAEAIATFARWQAEDKHVRVVLARDGSHTIYGWPAEGGG